MKNCNLLKMLSASVFSLYGQREAGMLSDAVYWKGTRDCVDLIQRLKRTKTLKGHSGCVNTIAWNSSGTRLVSGADDRHLKIYDTRTCLEFHSLLTTHQSNIFSARLLPSGEEGGIKVVSCAGIGSVEYSEITPTGEHISHPFQCHRSITYQVATTPGDSNEFMTCEEKGYVRVYDLRVKTECSCDGCKKDVLFSFPASVSSMAVHPLSPYYVAFGLGDGSVQVLDRRMINISQQKDASLHGPAYPYGAIHKKYAISSQARKITSVQFNHNGSELLASYSEDFVYLFGSQLLGCGSGGSEISKPAHLSHYEGYSPAVPKKRRKVGGVENWLSPSDASKSQGAKSNAKSPGKEPPAKKKLRLRGDWSDTGPEACPETEGSESRGQNLMNHMSNMFARWIDMSLSSDEQEREGGVESRARRTRRQRGRGMEETEERRAQRIAEPGEDLERCREGHLSSSSSDNSFNLFDEQEQETEEFGGASLESPFAEDKGSEGVCPGNDSGGKPSLREMCSDSGGQPSPRERCSGSGGQPSPRERCSGSGGQPSPRERCSGSGGQSSPRERCSDSGGQPSPRERRSGSGGQPSPRERCSGSGGQPSPRERCSGSGGQPSPRERWSGSGGQPSPRERWSGSGGQPSPRERWSGEGAHHTKDPGVDDGGDPNSIPTKEVAVTAGPGRTHHTKCSASVSDSTSDRAQHVKAEVDIQKCDSLSRTKDWMAATCSERAHKVESGSAEHSLSQGQDSLVIVENRTLNASAVPAINVIEDETDSDDEVETKVSCDHAEESHDLKQAGKCSEEGSASGSNCIKPFMVYKGHRNARTMIKQANFFGDNWVLSGSDCGRVFIWDKWSGEVVNMLMADNHVVNCIQPHPHAYLIATSGIDYDVKLWEPVEKDQCSLHDLDKVIERNNVMLEESRNTITMPSMIFLRVLSYLNRRRRMRVEENDSDEPAMPN